MRRQPIHVYLTAAIAAFLLSIAPRTMILRHPLVADAPKSQANSHYSAAIVRLEPEDLSGATGGKNSDNLLK